MIDGRRVVYDGTSAEQAYASGSLAACPGCAITHDLTVLSPVDVTGLGEDDLRTLQMEIHQPLPGRWTARTASGLASEVYQVTCACGTDCLAARSVGEWQPARWIALAAVAVRPAQPVASPGGRDWGQVVAVSILALVIAGLIGVHVYAAHSFLRGRATVRDGHLATVEVLSIDHDTGPRIQETWHAEVTDGTYRRRIRVSESRASRASVEHTLEVRTRTDPPLQGHVEVAGERRYDNGPIGLLVADALVAVLVAGAALRARRRA